MDRNTKYVAVLLMCFFCTTASFQQETGKTDSLLRLLATSKADTNKVKLLSDLSKSYFDAANYTKGIEISQLALALAQQLEFKNGIESSSNHLGLYYCLPSGHVC